MTDSKLIYSLRIGINDQEILKYNFKKPVKTLYLFIRMNY